MSTDTPPLDLQMPRRSIFNVDDSSDVQIACREGSVWITLDNDLRDIVLQAGESFTGTGHRRAIIYALAPSRLALAGGGFAASPRPAVKAAPQRTHTFAQAPA